MYDNSIFTSGTAKLGQDRKLRSLTLIMLAVGLTCISGFGQQDAKELVKADLYYSKAAMRSKAPLNPHFAKTEENECRIVFSRIDGDVENGPVAFYEAVFDDGTSVPLEANFMRIDQFMFAPEKKVAFRAVFDDGTRGNLTDYIDIGEGLNALEETGDKSVDAADAVAGVPRLTPPVCGPFTILRRGTSSNSTTGPWTFWQHETDYHRPGGGIGGADDTKAYDINLNVGRVSSSASNLDAGMGFYPVRNGTVTKWHGTLNSSSAILIEHTNGTAKFWSGYLHPSEIFARPGDYVTTETRIGKIGRSGNTSNDHLHLVVYIGSNSKNGNTSLLVSVDTQFADSSVSINPPGQQTIRKGETRSLPTWAYGNRPYSVIMSNLNSASLSPNTWWKSSNNAVATVDRRGNVRGVAVGTAQITVYFSGQQATTTVRVVN